MVAAARGVQLQTRCLDAGRRRTRDAAIDAPPDVPANLWWDDAWPMRMPLTITNASTTQELVAGYQVSMKLALSGTPCTARDDVRVVHAHTTQLDRIVDDVPGGPFYWFKLVAPIFKFENAVHETHTYDVAPPGAFSVRLWNYNSSPTVSFDMVRVRKAIDPAPTVTIGAAESKPL